MGKTKYSSEWYAANRTYALMHKKEWYDKNRARILQREALYRKRNKEKIREKDKAYYKQHRQRLMARQREYYRTHRTERLEARKLWALKYKGRRWGWYIAYRYGITVEQLLELLAKQGGRCAICRRKVRLQIDHCHKKRKVRGLLCVGCNNGLGIFRDGKLFAAASKYLSQNARLGKTR